MNNAEILKYHIGGQTISTVIEGDQGEIEILLSDGTSIDFWASRMGELNVELNGKSIWDIKIPTNEHP